MFNKIALTGLCWFLTLVLAVLASMSRSEAQQTGGPSRSGPGAEVYFIDLKDGATVPAKLKLYFGLRNMGIAPAGSERENSGRSPPVDRHRAAATR